MEKNVVAVCKKDNLMDYGNEKEIFDLVKNTMLNYLETQYSSKCISTIIHPGETVLIKPNWVHELNFLVRFDKKIMENPNDCFITNWNVVKAVIKLISEVDNLNIVILECPLQSCSIEKIITEEKLEELRLINQSNTITFIDGRRTKYIFGSKEPTILHECRDADRYIDFDLKKESTHYPYERYVSRFRVTDYPPDEMGRFHSKGHHVYRIAREVIEADCIINIPKIKTHMKAGMTAAMKNFVGVVGNKECLPHHTKGSPVFGGDCYGDVSVLKSIAETTMDIANSYMTRNEKRYYYTRKCALLLLYFRAVFGLDNDIGGSWYGNDTICRTIVDLNRIVYYGGKDKRMHKLPQRRVLSIVDGIVSGMGEGPMKPVPNHTGMVCISESTAGADAVASEIIGLDSSKIRYLAEHRVCGGKYDLSVPYDTLLINYNGRKTAFKDIKNYHPPIQIAQRWGGKIEKCPIENFTYFGQFICNLKRYPKYIKELLRL